MSDHVIRRGLDIPIKGRATGAPVPLDPPSTVAWTPTEFRGIVPKPAVREGDAVKAGSTLWFHKHNPAMVFRSPAAGRVEEIRRGRRRVVTDIVVRCEGDAVDTSRAWTLADLEKLDRDAAAAAVLATGMWSALRTRPLDRVADPADSPQSVFVVGTDTGPLQPGADELMSDSDAEPLRAAIAALKRLTGGPVHLTVPAGASHPAFVGAPATVHAFAGPHPAGDPAVQVNLVDPVRGNGQVWWIRAWDAADLGRALLTGTFPGERVYAAVGAGCRQPRFVRTLLGAPLEHIVGEVDEGDQRWIRGSVLTGDAVDPGRWASFYRRAVHILPEHVPRELFGWALPQLARWSFHKAYLSGWTGGGGREHDLRPGLFGGRRALMPVGYYSKVIATPDIELDYLAKAIISGDIEEAIELGLLDLSEEEAALATFICPSKMEFDEILREGLAMYEAEAL